MRPLVFKESGKIILAKFQADGTLKMDPSDMVIANGTVQSIQPNINFAVTELPDGNSLFPMGRYDTGVTGQVVVTMSSFQPNLYAALIGTSVKDVPGDTLWSADTEAIIPDETPYTIKLDHTPKTNGNLFVAGEDGTMFTKAEAEPEAGKYSVTDDTLTFAADDAGKTVFISYEWTTNAKTFGIETAGARPVLHAIISGYAVDEGELNRYPVNIIIDKCKATDNINMPPRQKTPEPWSFTLGVERPRPGRRPVDWKFVVTDSDGSPGTP